MGTRADFYVGLNPDTMKWLGSITWGGYPDGIPKTVLSSKSEEVFRGRVAELLATREDGTTPDMGWPWPWKDSQLTDYSYAFVDSEVWVTNYGYGWYKIGNWKDEDDREQKSKVSFPNMKDQQNVTFGKRSGVMIVTANGIYRGE